MKSSILLLCLLSFNAFATELTLVDKPSGVKVRAAAASWEKIYDTNMCYPDAITYKISDLTTSNWQNLILASAIASSENVLSFTSFKPLTTKEQVIEVAESMQSNMGVVADEKLAAQLIRVFEKKEVRQLYAATTTNGETRFELTGNILAILDHEKSEVVLLTSGDAFSPSSCSDE